MDPHGLDHIGWVMAAAIVGFIGNEAVAIYRIRVGRQIGSAALVADGQHAQVDGLTSLAVLIGALGVLAGWDLADPLIGALITFLILFILKDSAVMVWHRLMDAVDPSLVQEIENVLDSSLDGHDDVKGISDLRVRWLGHRLQLELNLVVDQDLTTGESHSIAERVRHDLFHAFPHLSSVMVHIDPEGLDHHDLTDHHTPTRSSQP
jgi:cation diffusion facilitator family transporter